MTALAPLLREAARAGLSFRFADGELRLSYCRDRGKTPPPDLLDRLRAKRSAIIAHFEHAQDRQARDQFVAAVQAIWPGSFGDRAKVVGERIYPVEMAEEASP